MEIDAFFEVIVSPTIEDFVGNRADLRKAYLAVWTVDSYASHIHRHLLKLDHDVEKSDIDYKKNIKIQSDSFSLILDISAATKHADLSQKSKSVRSSLDLGVFDLDGWLAWQANTNDWGEQVCVYNEKHFCRPVVNIVNEAMEFLYPIWSS